jgi:hypothetical protein
MYAAAAAAGVIPPKKDKNMQNARKMMPLVSMSFCSQRNPSLHGCKASAGSSKKTPTLIAIT